MYVIVRHGNTFAAGEAPRRIGARTDLPLTQDGLAQAQALGVHFAAQDLRFERILVSPLLRTRQTAQAIVDVTCSAVSTETAAFLCEIDHGPDENRSDEEVIARIGHAALNAWDSQGVAPPGWKVDADVRTAAWRELLAATPTGPTLLVTSNGAARYALLADVTLRAAAARLPSLKLPTGSYGVIARGRDGVLNVPIWGERP